MNEPSTRSCCRACGKNFLRLRRATGAASLRLRRAWAARFYPTLFWSSRCTFSWKEPARTRRRLVVVLAASHSSPACGCRPRRLAASRRRHSPYRRHRRHIDGVAAAAPATPADLCSLPPPPRIGHRPMGIALFLHHVCAMAVCVSVNVSLCAQPVVDWWFNRPRHMGAKTKGFRVLSL